MKLLSSTKKRKITIEVLSKRSKKNNLIFKSDSKDNISELATSAIELILSGIDIPNCLASEDENGKQTVVSQGRALNAVIQFVNGNFSLSNSSLSEDISNKSFNEITDKARFDILEYEALYSTFLEPMLTESEINTLINSFESLQ